MKNGQRYDVAIVGYGPVGQALAALLGRFGHRTIVFERFPTLYGNARAGHCDGETMRFFQSLGVARELELLMRPITSYELVSAAGDVLKRVGIGESGSGWKASYLFHQPELEDVLDANARGQASVTVRAGWEVIGLEQTPEEVHVMAQPRADDAARPSSKSAGETVTARFVVGADGANSFVCSALGIKRSDLGFEPFEFLVMDFEHANPDRSIPAMGEVRQILDPRRPTTAGRWNGNRWSRWEFMRMPGESREQMEDEKNCWKLLAPWGVGPGDGRIIRRAVYAFQSRLADRWNDGRIFLAGDAAHTMPPFMAQGLCSGMRDAANLGWKLDLVLRGVASPSIFSTYEIERKPHVRAITEMAMEVGRLVTVTDPAAAEVRDQALARGEGFEAHGLPSLQSGLLQGCREGTLGLLAGRLSPQARVHKDGRTGLLDDFLGAGWTIVSRHPLPEAAMAGHAPLLARLDVKTAHVTRGCLDGSFLDIDAEYATWFRNNHVEVFVQRPDFQIFGAAATVEGIADVLSSLQREFDAVGGLRDAVGRA